MVYRWLSRGWLAPRSLRAAGRSGQRGTTGGPLLNQHRAAVIGTLLGESQLGGERGSRRAGVDSRGPAIGLEGLAIAPIRGVSPRALARCGPTSTSGAPQRTQTGVWPVDPERRQHRAGHDPARHPRQREEREPAGGPAALPADPALHLRHSRHSPEPHHGTGEVRALDIAQLRWQNRGKRHQGSARPISSTGWGEHPGPHHRCGCPEVRLDRLKGQLYLGPELDISPMLARIHAGAPPVSGQLDFQLWSEFEKGRLGNSLLAFGNNHLIWKDEIKGSRTASTCRGQDPAAPGRRGVAARQPRRHLQARWRHLAAQPPAARARIGSRIQGYVPAIDPTRLPT